MVSIVYSCVNYKSLLNRVGHDYDLLLSGYLQKYESDETSFKNKPDVPRSMHLARYLVEGYKRVHIKFKN